MSLSAKVLVTGSSGQIGSRVLSELRRLQIPAVGTIRQAKAPARERVAWLDFTRPLTFGPALQGVRRVFLVLPADPRLAGWTADFVAAAKRAGIERIVKLSALGAEREQPFSFARWHQQADRHLEGSAIPHVILRPNGFMQNLVGFHGKSIAARGRFSLPIGECKISYIDADDVAAAAVAALLREPIPRSRYELTGPVALSGLEIAWILSAILGREIRFDPVSAEQAAAAMAERGVPAAQIRAVGEMMADYRAGHAGLVSPAFAELTGRPPRGFAEFAQNARAGFGG
jgi:uncharacterized protein YbjT (DUF2867 family)